MSEKDSKADKAERKVTLPIHVQLADQSRNVWRVFVANDITHEDLLKPDFWSHLARRFRPGDRIEAEPDNGAWLAMLRVIDAGAQYAKVQILKADESGIFRLDQSGQKSKPFPGYTIEYSGGHTQWRVIRDSDRKVLKDGRATQSDAFEWLSNHLKAMAA